MTHNSTELHYLTLEEIRQQLDVPIDQLRAFADRSEVRDHCGAVPNPRTRGVMWPPEAVPVLSHLLAMRQAGKLEPKNVKGYLADLEVSAIGKSAPSPGSALVGLSPRSADVATAQAIEHVGGALVPVGDTIAGCLERIAVAQEKQVRAKPVYDAAGAACFLGCTVRLLRRTVPPSFRLGSSPSGDRWYRRDLLNLKGS